METRVRPYNRQEDYQRVGDFLVETFVKGPRHHNWRQPRWEYMHFHPMLDESSLRRIGVWENAGRIVAVAHYETAVGEAFFEVRHGFEHLRQEMLEYAQSHLCHHTGDGGGALQAMINDFDHDFEAIAASQGFLKDRAAAQWVSEYVVPERFPAIELPGGFRLQSLADENDLSKVNRVLWKGFNHPGEPPPDGVEGRRKMQSAPNFRQDLTVVVRAPNGEYASFCGMWFDPVHRVCDVEPVATDPEYRRLGLGKAVVLEGIRRCAELGATVAYVGSGQQFYAALGFKRIFAAYPWVKHFFA